MIKFEEDLEQTNKQEDSMEKNTRESSTDNDKSFSIDPNDNRFPFCIVWTTLPLISWFLPFIGHTGIGSSKGIIHDFAGSYYISIDDFAFGAPFKFVKLDKSGISNEKWDKALHKANDKYKQTMHNLFCNNCHSHVADVLNNINYKGKSNWNMVTVWWLTIWNSQYISVATFIRTYLGFIIVLAIYFLSKLFLK